MSYRFSALALAAALSLAVTTAGAAKVYKWVDAQGNVQDTQTPPPPGAAKAEEIQTRHSPVSAEAARKQLEELSGRSDQLRQNRELVARDGEAASEQDAQRDKNCEIARSNMEVLTTSPRVQANDSSGNAFYLTDEVKQQKIAETQRQIDEFCD
jgi:hypothetical protein